MPLYERSVRALRALAVTLVLTVVVSGVGHAQGLVSYSDYSVFDRTPDQVSPEWTRVGNGPALILEGPELLLNDNSQGDLIAYQGLLGQIEASHSVDLRTEVKVYSNLGGRAAVIEVSRPGLEVVLRMYPGQLVLMERVGRQSPRWLGSASVDLTDFRQLRIHKPSINEDEHETITVEVDGATVIEARPQGGGELGVGRVLFGSIGYADVGASVWRWMDLQVEHVDAGGGLVPTASSSFGALKSRY